ncbi:MAG TPA: hypothetical protein VF210_06670 [Pseudomonadales bacterium]
MSIENGQRFIRFLRENPKLREQVRDGGSARFEAISAEAGASCHPYEVVAALVREIDAQRSGKSAGER